MSAAAYAEKKAIRTPLLRVRCETSGGGRECRIMDLTSSGAFIESFVPEVTGTRVGVQFQLPNGHIVCTAGIVQYHQFRVGFGVEFTDISSKDRSQIGSFLA